MAQSQLVLMAKVGAPHGVKGGVKLTVFAEDPLGLRRYNPFATGDGRTLKLTKVRAIGKALVGEFDGVGDRNGAEGLRGVDLFVPRQRLPRPDEDEFYHVDLIGLTAQTATGHILGTVRQVSDYGAGDILEIAGETTVLVPFTRAIVPDVFIDRGFLIVDPPSGLLEVDGGEPHAVDDADDPQERDDLDGVPANPSHGR
ncbi:MAG: ribosome maturation factor RimM [Pseudomonadota bacterium]